jgi:GT2 family glycosyltransferase
MGVDVSIIIVNYNTQALTEACVRSILEYTIGCTYEVLLVDNASKVGDVSFLAELDTRITYLPQATNLGFAKGNNKGWEVAKGAYILLLNSDTELTSDAITPALYRLKQEPMVGALSVALNYPDGRPQHPPSAFPSILTEFLALTRLERLLPHAAYVRRYYGQLIDPALPYKCDWIWGAFWMAPRHVLENMPGGKLPEDYFMYFEDVLWGWQIRKKQGLVILYDPVATVTHYISGSERATQTEEEKYRNKIFPNERRFLMEYRGKWYATIFYMLRMLHRYSLRTPADTDKANFYFKQLFDR